MVEPAFILPLEETESGDDIERHSLDYLSGVLLCLYTAIVISLSNILQVQLMHRGKEEGEANWSNDHLMIVSGKSPSLVMQILYFQSLVVFIREESDDFVKKALVPYLDP